MIGGISMGGSAALDLARLRPGRFCAVGGHSPALWRTGGETPRARSTMPRTSPATTSWARLREATVAYAASLRRNGVVVRLHLWPGDHSSAYWRAHPRAYLAFHARALERCS